MKERKYKEEYKLVTRLDEKTGKPKQIPVYIGDYYETAADRRTMALDCLPWLAGFIACYGVYMALSSPSSYCIYVLPFACCAIIPLLYACIGAMNALRLKGKMTRVQKETGIARLMRSFIGCSVFTALAVLGDVIFMFRNGFAGEWLAALLLAAASVSAWSGFARMRRIYNAMTVIPGRAAQEKAGDGV